MAASGTIRQSAAAAVSAPARRPRPRRLVRASRIASMRPSNSVGRAIASEAKAGAAGRIARTIVISSCTYVDASAPPRST